MGKYFGTDGFRAEANVGLTVEHAYKIGRFLGARYSSGHRGRIVIGKDTRRSGYMLEYALVGGICASGADAYLLHVTTTPSVSYVVRSEGFDAGIMISASHNPYYDNGIKLIASGGEKMGEELTDEIEEYIDGKIPDPPLAKRDSIGRTVDYVLGRNRYTGYLISIARHSFKGLRIGLDGANGSSWMLAKAVFDALGAKTYVIGDEPNGTNINDGCGSTHIEALCDLVRREGLDIGFAFDGDADRCLAVSELGKPISGEGILYLCAAYMRKTGELKGDKVVTTVMSNLGLAKALKQLGIDCIYTDVGDRFVWEAMREGGYSLGGEESGHIIFSKYATTGDGLITALRIMEVMLEEKKSPSALVAPLPRFPQITTSIRVADKDAVMRDERVLKAKAEAEKTLHGAGRILLRRSGTEPVVRIMAEHPNENTCRDAVEIVRSAVMLLAEK